MKLMRGESELQQRIPSALHFCIWCALAWERRLLTMLGAKVRDDQQLAKYAQSLLGQNFDWLS